MNSQFLWRGKPVPLSELKPKLASFGGELRRAREKLELSSVLSACNSLRLQLEGPLRAKFEKLGDKATVEELCEFLQPEKLEEKLSRELGLKDPFELERIDYRRQIFESWAPLGFIVHVAPTNAPNVAFLSVLEGLLTGNVCFLKTGRNESGLANECLAALVDCDPTRTMGDYVYSAPISSKNPELLRSVLREADGVAVWGGEEALSGIRELAPSHARVIEWGPKISFAYLDPKEVNDATMELLASDCSLFEQQACSSPQVIYLDTDDMGEVNGFAEKFSGVFEEFSSKKPFSRLPDEAEQAEITKVECIAKLETHLDGKYTKRVFTEKTTRVYVDANPALKASPLFRTVWVKPLPRGGIREVLWPMRHYLQTVGLKVKPERMPETLDLLYGSGVIRVTPIGQMMGGYEGEPHDGVYALQRYSRRVSFNAGADLSSTTRVSELAEKKMGMRPQGKILTKEDFVAREVDAKDSELFFKSGGTSGEPKLSIFTYKDYHAQMAAAARGLFAAGLTPATDKCMNLFFAGGLYGGFVSFFTILEDLEAAQLPMGAHPDLDFVAEMIVSKKVNTLLGMPSYLLRLFDEKADALSNYRGVKKIFYGGEHFSTSQRERLRKTFGVETIRSAAYGGNDTGPMGFQCSFCEGSVHHLLDELHFLEILHLDSEEPVSGNETGRLVLTSRVRHGQNLDRYDIGDLGRWVEDSGSCQCGRKSPKFELLGRYGDVFRAGGMFLDARTIANCLSERGYSGEIQLRLSSGRKEELCLRASFVDGWDADKMIKNCLESYDVLKEAVEVDKALDFRCEMVPSGELLRNPKTLKLRLVIDERK